jgi:hypothetical protein
MYYATGLPGWARGAGRAFNVNAPGAYGPWNDEDELSYLKNYASGLEESLTAIKMRITDLERKETPGAAQ